ncbi:4-hydroxythreonine-4-phosphate dehydrogenase PdxA [Pelagibacteraceae bacterium]|nr:4-hydroxythreonine-4-phosphate dehydrogenase PdxA [Pelagibacteraceae bacterium]
MKKIIISSGDPLSINSEIIYKSWKNLNSNLKKKIYIISNYNLIKAQFKKLKYKTKIIKVKNLNEFNNETSLKIIDVNLKFDSPFEINKINSSKFVINSLNYAHKLSLRNDVKGFINCPINKNLLKKKNFGVTEYLATLCKVKDNTEVMLIGNNKLKVSPLTTHIDVKDISKKIKTKLIIKKVKIINEWFRRNFKKSPKIGILGLNPHNAELRENSEERKIIIPAILKLKKLKFKIIGPLVSDTIFIDNYKKYDVLVGMYHDQVLTPFKSIFKFNGVNITLGLKYLRVSPDHGTAVDLIGKNKANITSFLKCVDIINKLGK